MTYDTHAPQPAGDYSRCRTASQIEVVLQGLPPRPPLDWMAGMRVLKHPMADVLNTQHPRLAALAEAKHRLPEVLDALAQLQEKTHA